MWAIPVILIIWVVLFSACIAVAVFPELDFVAKHGKQLSLTPASTSAPVPKILESLVHLMVPKAWFAHMYTTSLVMCAIFMSLEILAELDNGNYFSVMEGKPSCRFVVLFLFAIHSLRRFLESLYTFNYGKAEMHLAGYLVGILYYVLVPLTLFTEAGQESFVFKGLMNICGLILFLGGNFAQNRFHCYLGTSNDSSTLTRGSNSSRSLQNKYKYPVGLGFDHVYCPHYTAEVILYFGLNLMVPYSLTLKVMLLFVAANLSITADKNYAWYLEKFPAQTRMKGYASRRRIFPYIY
jgi:3-oxo-5-alpha-steroid 4-dehydrogenase 3